MLLRLYLAVVSLALGVASSWARSGKIVRGVSSYFSSSQTMLLDAELRPNHLWPGPPIHVLVASTPAIDPIVTVTASPAPANVFCVIDGRGVLKADRSATQFSCNLQFLSFGGLHSVAAYGMTANGKLSRIGEPIWLVREESASSANPLDKLHESESALRARTPPGTATIVSAPQSSPNPPSHSPALCRSNAICRASITLHI